MKKKILLFLTLSAACVIFAQSMLPAQTSTVESDAVYDLLTEIMDFFKINNLFTSLSIRKFAHFFEFAVFGCLLTSTCIAYGEKIRKSFFKIFFIMLAVPVADEFIQYFSEGRSSQVSDVILDFCGCILGFAVAAVITEILKHKILRKQAANKDK